MTPLRYGDAVEILYPRERRVEATVDDVGTAWPVVAMTPRRTVYLLDEDGSASRIDGSAVAIAVARWAVAGDVEHGQATPPASPLEARAGAGPAPASPSSGASSTPLGLLEIHPHR